MGATLAAINGIGTTYEAASFGRRRWQGGGFSPLAARWRIALALLLCLGPMRRALPKRLMRRFRLTCGKQQAMEVAFAMAKPGDCVLLSPPVRVWINSPTIRHGDAFRHWVEHKRSELTP